MSGQGTIQQALVDDNRMAVVLLKVLLKQGIINQTTYKNTIEKNYHPHTSKSKEAA